MRPAGHGGDRRHPPTTPLIVILWRLLVLQQRRRALLAFPATLPADEGPRARAARAAVE